MEILSIVVLSVFAFYGIFIMVTELLKRQPKISCDSGFRMIITIPENAEESLEGVIRRTFYEEIPGKLMTDRKLYVATTGRNAQVSRILRDMQEMYPIEVLPQVDRYCIITGSDFYSDD